MNTPAFLNDEEVIQLTGYRKPSKQIEFLTKRRIPFRVNRWGRPVVSRDLRKEAVSTFELGPVP